MVYAHYTSDNEGYKHTPKICNTLLFHGNNGYAQAPQCYVYTCIVCLAENEFFTTRVVQQRQHLFAVGCRTCFSGLIIMCMFGILQIPSACIQICVECIASTSTSLGYGDDTKCKVSLLR
jgi:hypothetical protein